MKNNLCRFIFISQSVNICSRAGSVFKLVQCLKSLNISKNRLCIVWNNTGGACSTRIPTVWSAGNALRAIYTQWKRNTRERSVRRFVPRWKLSRIPRHAKFHGFYRRYTNVTERFFEAPAIRECFNPSGFRGSRIDMGPLYAFTQWGTRMGIIRIQKLLLLH